MVDRFAALGHGELGEVVLGRVDGRKSDADVTVLKSLGMAVEDVVAADLVLLAPQAVFKAHYATAGFGPDGGWTALVGRLAGRRRAAAALLLNRSIRAEEAVVWGLANEIVAAEALHEAATAAARKIAAYPAGTMRAAKRLLWGDRAQLAADLEAERARFVELIASPEAVAGVDAFLRDFASYPDAPDLEDAKC